MVCMCNEGIKAVGLHESSVVLRAGGRWGLSVCCELAGAGRRGRLCHFYAIALSFRNIRRVNINAEEMG